MPVQVFQMNNLRREIEWILNSRVIQTAKLCIFKSLYYVKMSNSVKFIYLPKLFIQQHEESSADSVIEFIQSISEDRLVAHSDVLLGGTLA